MAGPFTAVQVYERMKKDGYAERPDEDLRASILCYFHRLVNRGNAGLVREAHGAFAFLRRQPEFHRKGQRWNGTASRAWRVYEHVATAPGRTMERREISRLVGIGMDHLAQEICRLKSMGVMGTDGKVAWTVPVG